MRRGRAIPAALGARIAQGTPLWLAETRRRALSAYRSPLSVQEYVAGCPRYVLAYVEAGRAPTYYGHRSVRSIEEDARELLVSILRTLEGAP